MNSPTAAGYTAEEPTHAPPWHGLVVWDVFFNACATGVFLTTAVGELARPATFAPVAVWGYPIALALLLIDLTLLVLDLGDPLRFHHMLRVVKLSSPMSLGTWCLTLFSLPLAAIVAIDVLVIFSVLPEHSSTVEVIRKVLLGAGLPFCFGSMAYKGVLFSTSAQPGWRDARWFGAYHVASAFAFGSAILLALAAPMSHDHAASVLRVTTAVLVVVQLVPLVMLARELWPTLVHRYSQRQLRAGVLVALSAGVLFPLALVFVESTWTALLVVVSVLAAGWEVRRLIVTLPHH
jgi:hypothetical protein